MTTKRGSANPALDKITRITVILSPGVRALSCRFARLELHRQIGHSDNRQILDRGLVLHQPATRHCASLLRPGCPPGPARLTLNYTSRAP